METSLAIQEHQYLDVHNPAHFINLVTPKLRELIFSIPNSFFELSENKLIREVYPENSPDETDVLLRMGFWEEYQRCFLGMKKMQVEKICDGVMSAPNLYHYLSPRPGALAYIITEPQKVQNRLKYAFHLSVQNMIELIKKAEQINVKTGLPDAKLMSLKVDLFKYLDQRLHGSIIQKIEQKNLNVNVETTPGQLANMAVPDDIDEKLRTIEAELSTHNVLPPAQNASTIVMDQIMEESGRVSDEFKGHR